MDILPFCRKCGRRLPEYSQVCTDCGQSTTAPIIKLNTKHSHGTHFYPEGTNIKITKTINPSASPQKIKTNTNKQTKTTTHTKTSVPTNPQTNTTTPINSTPRELPKEPKPVLSAKHIIKPKKIKTTKPIAPFTLTNARPVAGLDIAQPRPVTTLKSQPPPIPNTLPTSVTPTKPRIPPQADPVVIPITTAPTKPAPPSKTKTTPTPTEPVSLPQPITPTASYPPHEIKQSNISLKKDILINAQDYETECFSFDLECCHGHFWPAGKALPISNDRAYCLQCGERLRKPKPKRKTHRRRRSISFHSFQA